MSAQAEWVHRTQAFRWLLQEIGNVGQSFGQVRLFRPPLGLNLNLVDHLAQTFNEPWSIGHLDLPHDFEAMGANRRGELADQVIGIDLLRCQCWRVSVRRRHPRCGDDLFGFGGTRRRCALAPDFAANGERGCVIQIGSQLPICRRPISSRAVRSVEKPSASAFRSSHGSHSPCFKLAFLAMSLWPHSMQCCTEFTSEVRASASRKSSNFGGVWVCVELPRLSRDNVGGHGFGPLNS